ncbi:MAG: NifB/NifX family molybdenum-iron cluster-binding protein [Desulfovibrionales bacterium]|nr:NifB/NifX family molybdenum-iron cluster-binding protein [Desulfovibrionales bacterium]
MKKVLVTLYGEEVCPRFDHTAEVWIGTYFKDELVEERTVVLSAQSAEEVCHTIVAENIAVVVCGAIEKEFFDYLTWKRVTVYDFVAGTLDDVRGAIEDKTMRGGMNFWTRSDHEY